ncbi:hypothetical protein POSPLADRAFT_1131272 [Postia placenta MAD-698-R-SB12]|uniref:DUF6593 domain-containing protein n=1 Tax=Postia placenta MAD-698-R-SB12 TaxID=670580 RepID=A0A1X6NB75_9APHY|nr:hypothetical protein POSPLADRAFT_1131272 [Postia placenta MAD-698-R-SB12]OSX65824.1 hypothetical protein POSPLADRAFT_1131272 [Postia placenta MAD-698-R-SB12]
MPPPPKPKPPLKMFIALNSIRNTTFAVEDDFFYYEVVTRFWNPNITKIIQHDFEVRELTLRAEIEGLHSPAPRVRFGGEKGEWVPASQFVKFDPDSQGGTFATASGLEFTWKLVKRRWQLVRADDPEQKVIDFRPYKRHGFVFRMSQHAYLEVKPESEVTDAFDRIIASYLLVERKRRAARPTDKIKLLSTRAIYATVWNK